MKQDTTVIEIQEWLVLAGHNLVIDGVMGPKTREALGLSGTWITSGAQEALAKLRAPLRRACQPLAIVDGIGLGDAMVSYARRFLAEKPRELPGSAYRPKRAAGNRGPWVRFLGEEGLPWCAGFVSAMRRLSAVRLGLPQPFSSLSCDGLGQEAAKRGALSAEPSIGAIALMRRPGHHGWHHCGIVADDFSDVVGRSCVRTIEGNTNDDGSREGIGVFEHVRSVAGLDFVRVG